MSKRELLKQIDFGHRIAEEEGTALASYFVETDNWRRLVNGEVDVVYPSPHVWNVRGGIWNAGAATETRSGETGSLCPAWGSENRDTVCPPEDAGLQEPWNGRCRTKRPRPAAARSNLRAYS